MPQINKLSASAISTYLKSPKQFYYRYVLKIEPIQPSVGNFDEAKIFGVLWAEFVDRFYKGVGEGKNTTQLFNDWTEQTDGWVPEKKRDALTKALHNLAPSYYNLFLPEDGARTPEKSELRLENDRFVGILDGLGDDGIIHEVKTTSRSPQLAEQLWKFQHSLQVRLYAVLAQAEGVIIEFAFKDSPYAIYRAEPMMIKASQREEWEKELNALADQIYSLGDDPDNYPCHTDGCCMVTKGFVSMCPYSVICDIGLTEATKLFYKPKKHRSEQSKS